MNYSDDKTKGKYAAVIYSVFTLCFVIGLFAPRIRGPPNLDLIHSNSHDRRSHYGMAEKRRTRTR